MTEIPLWSEWHALNPGASKLRYDELVRKLRKQ